ncbi:MAG TPA: alpha/beta hydrolase, partial [Streptosporangiales bacterium]
MPIADLDGVAMWYDAHGQGEPLVFLHPGGAGVDSRALTPQVESLSARFRVYTPEQRGHGRTPDVEGPASFESMATDTIAFIETVAGAPVHLLGCSDGASLALTVALRRP